MAISNKKQRVAVSLDKDVLKIIDDIAKASPQPLTRSQVITFAVAEFYLSILETEEKKGEKA